MIEWDHPDHHVFLRTWQVCENEWKWETPLEYGYEETCEDAIEAAKKSLFWYAEVICEEN